MRPVVVEYGVGAPRYRCAFLIIKRRVGVAPAFDVVGWLGAEDDFQLAFSPGNFSQLTPEAFRFRGTAANRMDANPGHNIRVAAVKTSDGYTLEATIPWADLGVTPRAGLVMGLNLNANDNDSPGTAVQEVMMSNVSTRTFSNPTTWGMVTLEE